MSRQASESIRKVGVLTKGTPGSPFCRGGDGEVIIHIARICGVYFLASPSFEGIASGSDIGVLVRDLVARHPLIQTRAQDRGSNIFLHPAALLTAIVATAFFKATEARALADNTSKSRSETRGEGTTTRLDAVLAGTVTKPSSLMEP